MNNFNTSTTGIDIGLAVEFDAGMARIDWEINFKRIGNSDKFAYIDYGYLSGDMPEIQPLPRQKGKIIQAMIKKSLSGFDSVFLDYYTKQELKGMSQDMLVSVLDEILYDEKKVQEFYNEHGIKTNANDIVEVSITGYSQGNYATILVNAKEFEEIHGAKFKEEDYKDYFTNLFYNQPLCVRATVNDKEYHSERFDGQYVEFDKDEYIAELVASVLEDQPEIDKDVLIEELEEIVPDYPKHNGY